jgi:hypothetical protein
MSDKKLTYGKGLTALKKKFNTGGRVNARRGGIKEFTGFQQIEQMGEVIQTPELIEKLLINSGTKKF